ncbi:hypothetical protein WOB53_02825 [Providencia rettgeri]|uniref:hypothetical protein n=1 Tax=Providencia rettgeri TaxID=587 RepID=UPI0034E6A40C
MEFKGTPAPWIIIDGDDYFNITAKSTESSPNYMPLLDSDSIGMIEMRANAHLIAAAPELLEALIELTESAKEAIDGLGDLADAIDTAKAAIAKALGQQ